MSFRDIAAAIAMVCVVTNSGAEESRFGALVDGDGGAETYGYCVSCHSEKLVAQQGMSRSQWDETLDWMTEEQGMVEIPDQVRSKILDYLALNYGPDRPNYPVR